jgi:hypothetical protein
LASQSQYFLKLFGGSMAESKEKEINIEVCLHVQVSVSITCSSFLQFQDAAERDRFTLLLEILYLKEIAHDELSSMQLLDLLLLADKYQGE